MTVAPLRPDPVVVKPEALKKPGMNTRTAWTIAMAVAVLLVALLAVYVTVRTVSRGNNIRRQQPIERQQNTSRRPQDQTQPSTTPDIELQTRTVN